MFAEFSRERGTEEERTKWFSGSSSEVRFKEGTQGRKLFFVRVPTTMPRTAGGR